MSADLTGYEGKWIEKRTGEAYGLKIVPVVDPEFGHTHELKNEIHFWSGTEKQFREQFQK